MKVPFSKSCIANNELDYVKRCIVSGRTSSNGDFTKKVISLLRPLFPNKAIFLTASGTASLEMALLLSGVGPGDEVILPSFTFSSSANAVVLRGAKPVFVDIAISNLCIDLKNVEAAISKKTKAIMNVHYAGHPGFSAALRTFCDSKNLIYIEDAAQSFLGAYADGTHFGNEGHIACFSFHETKSFSCGEGGAIIVDEENYGERAEILLEKGTNRLSFTRRERSFYEWCDIGSSFAMGDINAAFLLGQIEQKDEIISKRESIWKNYHKELDQLLKDNGYSPNPPFSKLNPNFHMYWALAPSKIIRKQLLEYLKNKGIIAASHYVALHSSTFGMQFHKKKHGLPNTDIASDRLFRLPLFNELTDEQLDWVLHHVKEFVSKDTRY